MQCDCARGLEEAGRREDEVMSTMVAAACSAVHGVARSCDDGRGGRRRRRRRRREQRMWPWV